MVSSLSETLDSGFMAITVIEAERERPTPEELEELDEAVVSRFGWAFRFGMGASNSLNDFRYGYIIGGHVLNPNTIGDFESKLQSETRLNDPTVLFKSVQVPDEEFNSMEKLGKLPHEVLSALDGLVEDIEDAKED